MTKKRKGTATMRAVAMTGLVVIGAMLAGPAGAASRLPEEYRQIDADFDRTPARPAPADPVRALQQRLGELGYTVGPIDGRWGPRTRAAARAFLADHGQPDEDGLTVERIESLVTPAAAGTALATPPAVAEAPTAPEAVPPALWHGRDLLGRPLHLPAGDRIASVADLVLSADGAITGVIAALPAGSARAEDQRLIAWEAVRPWLGRRAIVLGLDVDSARALRAAAPPVLAPGQFRLTRLFDAPLREAGTERGDIADAGFDAAGRLERFELSEAAALPLAGRRLDADGDGDGVSLR
ncbi:peptidoglycan-binding domain-containing protein [Phaeospirillum tilakii]|uniref:Peptidoglycan-binding protein n=1 Tax=Phaeospirillum tilakii TaxID=741673 RepID=A0ABW5C6J7_9PROT